MGELIELFPETETVWVCDCGCESFKLMLTPTDCNIIGACCSFCGIYFTINKTSFDETVEITGD